MSINLGFTHKSPEGKSTYIDLPIQTPTDLTLSVLAAGTTEIRLGLLKTALLEWEYKQEAVTHILGDIERMLDDPNYTLVSG